MKFTVAPDSSKSYSLEYDTDDDDDDDVDDAGLHGDHDTVDFSATCIRVCTLHTRG